jgi:hypothetical protein
LWGVVLGGGTQILCQVSKNFTFYARVDIEKHKSEMTRISNVLRFSMKIDIHFTCVVGLNPIKCILLSIKVTHWMQE